MKPKHAIFANDQLYSAEEVRTKLGGKLHRMTIWRWARQGKLPKPYRIGNNTTRWLGSELNKHLRL